MTEENKPSWQYIPPQSPTVGDTIDATRYMKGAPRRSENPSSPVEDLQTPSQETVSAASDRNENSAAEENSNDVSVSQSESPEITATSAAKEPISYDVGSAPAATEYSASSASHANGESYSEGRRGRYGHENRRERREFGRQREFNRDNRPDNNRPGGRENQNSYRPHRENPPFQTPQKIGFFASMGVSIKRFWNKLCGKKEDFSSPRREFNREGRPDEFRGGRRLHSHYRRGGRGSRGRGGYRGSSGRGQGPRA